MRTEPGEKKMSDGVVCKECLRKSPPYFAGFTKRRRITVEQLSTAIEEKARSDQRMTQFQATDQVGKRFAIDREHGWFLVHNPDACLPCDAIVDFDLVENGHTVVDKKGLGSAMVGGALFGVHGAMIGYSRGRRQVQEITSLYVKIATRITGYSVVKIQLIYSRTKSSGLFYKASVDTADEIMSLLATAVSLQNDVYQTDQAAPFSVADELAKLSQLLDNGVITQQEFDDQKKKLLA